jgi:hypothetical protein
MKMFGYDRASIEATYNAALKKNFGGDAEKMLIFMCRNTWDKALKDGGKSFLAYGPYWWSVKRIIEETIGSQWGETQADNPIMRKVFRVRTDRSAPHTLMLADEYRIYRLGEFGTSPHHELDGTEEGEEYTLEDSDMLQFMFA